MPTFKKLKYLDSFCRKEGTLEYMDAPLLRFVQKEKNETEVFSRFGRAKEFTSPALELHHIKSGKNPDFRSLDGFLRFEKRLPLVFAMRNGSFVLKRIERKYGSAKRYLGESVRGALDEMSLVRAWNVSVVGALIFGMFIMTFIYRYLGQGAAADSGASNMAVRTAMVEEIPGAVAGESIERPVPKQESVGKKGVESDIKGRETDDHVSKIMEEYSEKTENRKALEGEIRKMVKGHPIEKMAPFIAQQDPIVAAFLVSIARKESSWGERVPVLDGKDCYNYWGYRGIRKRMGTGGHTCFDSPEDAVKTVAKRIRTIVKEEKADTPEKMVTVWKCGYDCSWDNPASVRKWADDVDHYFKKLYKR